MTSLLNNGFNALGNKALFENTIYWCLDRTDLLNISPRPIKTFQLTLSREKLTHIALNLSALLTPIALFGIIIYILRRR